MNIFVTGASGFVGHNVLDYLRTQVADAKITCLLREPKKLSEYAGAKNIALVHGDLLKPETYRDTLKDAHVIIHAAALVSLRNGPEFYTANVEATHKLLDAAQGASGLSRFVFVGSISSFEREPGQKITGPVTEVSIPYPATDYGKSKLEAERLVRESGLPYTIVRPSYIYGPHPRVKGSMDRLIDDVREGKRYTQLPLPGRATAIYAPDLAEAIWTCAMHPACFNESFFVGDETPVNVGDAYKVVAGALGMTYEAREVSPEAMDRLKVLVYRRRPDESFVKVLFEDYFWASSKKLMRLTGWRPRHTLMEGVAKTIGWYRARGLLS